MSDIENKHHEMVSRNTKSGDEIISSLNGDKMHLLHMAVGISGEAGELLDAIKKASVYNKPLDRENVLEELGDIEFYLQGMRQGLGITREDVLLCNVNKLSKRYPKGYTDKAAQERADKMLIPQECFRNHACGVEGPCNGLPRAASCNPLPAKKAGESFWVWFMGDDTLDV